MRRYRLQPVPSMARLLSRSLTLIAGNAAVVSVLDASRLTRNAMPTRPGASRRQFDCAAAPWTISLSRDRPDRHTVLGVAVDVIDEGGLRSDPGRLRAELLPIVKLSQRNRRTGRDQLCRIDAPAWLLPPASVRLFEIVKLKHAAIRLFVHDRIIPQEGGKLLHTAATRFCHPLGVEYSRPLFDLAL